MPPVIAISDAQATMLVLVPILICIDVVSGLVKAGATIGFKSFKLREGLWHKAGEILVMVLALAIDTAQTHVDLGFTVPLTVGAGIYLTITEVTSILENVAAANPDIAGGALKRIFSNTHDANDGAAAGPTPDDATEEER